MRLTLEWFRAHPSASEPHPLKIVGRGIDLFNRQRVLRVPRSARGNLEAGARPAPPLSARRDSPRGRLLSSPARETRGRRAPVAERAEEAGRIFAGIRRRRHRAACIGEGSECLGAIQSGETEIRDHVVLKWAGTDYVQCCRDRASTFRSRYQSVVVYACLDRHCQAPASSPSPWSPARWTPPSRRERLRSRHAARNSAPSRNL